VTAGPETEILAGVSVSHSRATVDQIETAASASPCTTSTGPQAIPARVREQLLDDS
jgi:hypothetical protein